MNRHELLDEATTRLSGVLARGRRLFDTSLDSPPVTEFGDQVDVSVPDVAGEGTTEFEVETPVGAVTAGVMVWQWRGPDAPTVIYHHGNRENPFALGRFSKQSFKDIFVNSPEPIPANVVAVRAPFHDVSFRQYMARMGYLADFVAMVAVSTEVVEGLVADVHEVTTGPVTVSGVSLGGWVVNLHRALYDTADAYVPLLAGAALDDLFIESAFRHVTSERARFHPETLRSVLNFEDAFEAVTADDVFPLLARYDRIIRYDRQKRCYGDREVRVLDKGHVTGALARDALRGHVMQHALQAPIPEEIT